jgi:hypothetical protein
MPRTHQRLGQIYGMRTDQSLGEYGDLANALALARDVLASNTDDADVLCNAANGRAARRGSAAFYTR